MKPRAVLVLLEVETDATINELKQVGNWACELLGRTTFIRQAQTNMIQKTKPTQRGKRSKTKK